MLWQSQSSAKGRLEHLWSAIPMGRLTLVEMVEEVSSKLDALESSVDALSTKIANIAKVFLLSSVCLGHHWKCKFPSGWAFSCQLM